MSLKFYTQVFIRDLENRKLLLGYKKRSFGKGKWTGVGGKVEPNETVIGGAIRETKKETGLDISNLNQVGYFEYRFEPNKDKIMACHIFISSEFRGEIQENDEIKPEWFDENDLPTSDRWADDEYWLEHILNGKFVKACLLYSEDNEVLIEKTVRVFDTLDSLKSAIPTN